MFCKQNTSLTLGKNYEHVRMFKLKRYIFQIILGIIRMKEVSRVSHS